MFKLVALAALLVVGAQAQIRLLNLGGGNQGFGNQRLGNQGFSNFGSRLSGNNGQIIRLDQSSLSGLSGLQNFNGNSDQIFLLLSNQEQNVPQPQIRTVAIAQPRARAVAAPQPQVARIAAPAPQVVSRAEPEIQGPPQPYQFEYTTTDDAGTQSSREEKSDGNTVTGSYGYLDVDGVTRTVDYVADENGFRANVRTNEPGTGRNEQIGDPADTQWDIQPTPQGVVERYINAQAIQPQTRVTQQQQPQIRVIQQQQPAVRNVAPQQPAAEQYVLIPASQARELGLFGNRRK